MAHDVIPGTLAVLAGGKGRRMGGVAKGLLRRDGQTLIERLAALGQRFAQVMLVAPAAHPYGFLRWPVVNDVVRGCGAPGGVHAALSAAATEWVMVVACDMPFVDAPVLQALWEARGDAEVTCFEAEGRSQPFPGLYRRLLAGRWEKLLSSGPSFQALWREAQLQVLPEQLLRAVDPSGRSVRSVNTPDQAAAWGIECPSELGVGPTYP